MEQVVERGTAKAAQIDGFTVAGKTGTARSWSTTATRTPTTTRPSSASCLPASRRWQSSWSSTRHTRSGYYGGTVAAPIFKRIAEESLRHLGIGPTINPAPPVLVARNTAEEMIPQPVSASQTMDPSAPPSESVVDDDVMPDLRGLSAREALRALTKIGMTARMSGDGFVLEQSPAAGSALGTVDACIISWVTR